MELPQAVDVDCAVIHPDTLQPGVGSCRLPNVKHRLVEQIEYVAHFRTLSSFHPIFAPIFAPDNEAVSRSGGQFPVGVQMTIEVAIKPE
jgi:hypothetical protein